MCVCVCLFILFSLQPGAMKELIRLISELTAKDFNLIEQAITGSSPPSFLLAMVADTTPPSILLQKVLVQLKDIQCSDSGVYSESDIECTEENKVNTSSAPETINRTNHSSTLQLLLSQQTSTTESDANHILKGVHIYHNGEVVAATGGIGDSGISWKPADMHVCSSHQEAVSYLWQGDQIVTIFYLMIIFISKWFTEWCAFSHS